MKTRIQSTVKKTLASLALLSVELIIALVLFFLAGVIFIVVAYRIFRLKSEQFDFDVFTRVDTIVSPGLTSFINFITVFGNYQVLIPANLLLIAFFLFIKKHKWYSIKVPVIALGGVSLMFLLKQIFNRPRPLIPLLEPFPGLSFPSGHAMMSMSFYGLLIYLAWQSAYSRTWKWLATILLSLFVLLIGFSRIYLRAHYFSDVIAGFSVGIIWLIVSIWAVNRMERFSRKKIDPLMTESKIAKA
ncbi:MAG: phosphatase PAP2 family protein [Chitinophagales bacterium]